jgi:hypothetical protein
MDHAGLPLATVLNQLELLGGEVVPVLRKEFAARRAAEVAGAPTHEALVKAKYGDAPPRQPVPNANRGDNLTGTSPYQDTDEKFQANSRTSGNEHPTQVRLDEERAETNNPGA